MTTGAIAALLFDKDGTLFDFHLSWAGWTDALLRELADGDPHRHAALAEATGFDAQAVRFHPSSPFIAGTLDEGCARLLPHLPGWEALELRRWMVARSGGAQMVPPLPLPPLLQGLRDRGLVLGVATNDAEGSARAQLDAAAVTGFFDVILGADSGYTPKPAPDMLLGFAEVAAVRAEATVMIGDSTHDLHAGRAAGMRTVAVLTGMASAADLAPHADHVLDDIGALPALLDNL